MTYDELTARYPVFTYESFDVVRAEDGLCRLVYRFVQSDDIVFTPSWTLGVPYDTVKDDTTVRAFAFSIGLVELVSYWKACCSPTVHILCGALDDRQVAWWKKLWYHGLGEFFYRNGIKTDINTFMRVFATGQTYAVTPAKALDGNLICVGGGKDSAVTMDLMKRHKNRLYCVNGAPSVARTVAAAGYKQEDLIIFKRTLDRKIVELNAAGYLNGHTPFSAVLAFSASLCAYLYGLKNVVLSNESSANDVYVQGTDVNHQYSKSFAFENDFRAYLAEYLTCGVNYYSLLRPLNEWNIVKRFVRLDGQLDAFLSCNLGQKNDRWCCACPKCLFTYIMLSAFVGQDRLVKVFGKNLLDDEAMLPYLDGLVCEQFDKPFECIGTRAEINAALCAAVRKNGTGLLLLKKYVEKYGDAASDYTFVDTFFDKNNNVPDDIREELQWNAN